MAENLYGYWLPQNLSLHGAKIDALLNGLHVFLLVLFVAWLGFFIYILFRFSAKKNSTPFPKKFRWQTYFEVALAMGEMALLIFLSIPLWSQIVNSKTAPENTVTVRVTAEQYAWNIHYPGPDGLFGRTDSSLITADNSIGLDRADLLAKDDLVTVNELNLPIHRSIRIILTSKDVIHNFFLPVLRVKQDVIPGQVAQVFFEATGERENLEIACAQLCGLGHYRMRGLLNLWPQEKWNSWMQEEQKRLAEENRVDP